MSEREQTGRVVDGRFELLQRLGSGGMGTVWRARDIGLHREVAIKEVRPTDAALYENNPALAAQQRERVLRESRALARLQHPNVVSIYQIIESPDSPYPWIVMELVQGMSLDTRLQHGTLTPPEAARVGRGVLAALRAAHAAGVMHRDVKPGNVLLRHDGSAVLTDFGIAALHDSGQLTATGEVIGSPEYIAPERLHGDETKTASDFWSLAMLLYVAVEGYHPLRRATTMATLAAVMTEPVPPPRRAGALGQALAAVLVADPMARPSGEVFDRMLAAAEHGGGVPFGQAGPGFAAPGTPSGPLPAQGTPSGAFPAQNPPSGSFAAQSPPSGSFPAQGFPAQGTPSGGFPARTTAAWQYPNSQTPDSGPRPVAAPGRKRTGAIVFSLTAVLGILALTIVLVRVLGSSDNAVGPGDGGGSESTSQHSTGQARTDTPQPNTTKPQATQPQATQPNVTSAAPPTADAPTDLRTPAGGRALVGALSPVMGGSKVSELYIYEDYARATAPVATVKNGFDNFEYRDGAATREGADGVDSDRAVLDLNKVNWDALPGLWDKANKELGVPAPTMRYIIIDTDIIDGSASMRLYVNDDYGATYLEADLSGKVQRMYKRDK
ncbi:serine/threonine-protein kinase [Actinokineospora enzanensis]|uniref:serine/threonine-protein kinase n=1 Tax=Actinokineospora enzanensis TaxID=155975 RepID=UPI00047819C9|nr:serine/threonine protein kinase [Actinokineospora enzanensis]